MRRAGKLAPSVLGADFGRLAERVRQVESEAALFHVDVMDGHFVPPITIGPVVVRALRAATSRPLECHLMVERPLEQIEQFAEAGADSVLVHLEAAPDPGAVFAKARSLGLGVGLCVSPPTPVTDALPFLESIDVLNVMTVNPGWAGQTFIAEMLPKIRRARAEIDRGGLAVDLTVDGGVTLDTGCAALDAGADVLVAATSVFGRPDPAAAAREFNELLRARGERPSPARSGPPPR
ncbi:MAG: ribulose-phosphate 3-epimerase [Acidobacteria bacterium]|nr:ribulose-phosphate 3-epimerase [Acidobacteriota bacterium]